MPLSAEPWAIDPRWESTIARAYALVDADGGLDLDSIRDRLALAAMTRRDAVRETPVTVGILPITGIISHRRLGLEGLLYGGTTVLEAIAYLQQYRADRAVTSVLLDVDSPGGSVSGAQELHDAIASVARVKPVIAHANTLMASAAYWACSAATEIVGTTSAEVGSIGVLALHLSVSDALKKVGITPTLVRSAPHKAESNDVEPLSAAAKQELQRSVDFAHDRFIRAVAAGRRVSPETVRARFGCGRVLEASRALTAGMIDRIGTFNVAVARAATLGDTPASQRALAQADDGSYEEMARWRLKIWQWEDEDNRARED